MTYPPQPGQYPGSGAFPQSPGQYPAMPPMPQYPGAGGQQAGLPPSGGTAITAGVLAVLGFLWATYCAIVAFSGMGGLADNSLAWVVWLSAIGYVLELLLLGPGSILLFIRKPAGRWMVVIGCLLHIVLVTVTIIGTLSQAANALGNTGAVAAVGGIAGFIVLVPAIATLVLALVPLTGRWIAWGSQPPAPSYGQPPNYGPPPGYGQPPQAWS